MKATQSTVISMRLPAASGKRLKRMASATAGRRAMRAHVLSKRVYGARNSRSSIFGDSTVGLAGVPSRAAALLVWEVMLLVRSHKDKL